MSFLFRTLTHHTKRAIINTDNTEGDAMNNPLFIQIYEDYKKFIILGLYKPGDKLPSVREVAEEKGINPHTVNRAYQMLEAEGYVETIFKKGSFVKAIDDENEVMKQIKKDITNWKNQGIKQQDLVQYIKKVYGDDSD